MIAIRERGPEERWASGTGQSARAIRNPPSRPCACPRSFLSVVAYQRPSSSSPSPSIHWTVATEPIRRALRVSREWVLLLLFLLLYRERYDLVIGRIIRELRVLPPDSRTITKPEPPPPPLLPPPRASHPRSARLHYPGDTVAAPREPSRGSRIWSGGPVLPPVSLPHPLPSATRRS